MVAKTPYKVASITLWIRLFLFYIFHIFRFTAKEKCAFLISRDLNLNHGNALTFTFVLSFYCIIVVIFTRADYYVRENDFHFMTESFMTQLVYKKEIVISSAPQKLSHFSSGGIKRISSFLAFFSGFSVHFVTNLVSSTLELKIIRCECEIVCKFWNQFWIANWNFKHFNHWLNFLYSWNETYQNVDVIF